MNDYFQNMQRIVHTKGYMDTDPYGKPAWIYEHEGGIKGIANDMQKMLLSDLSQNLNVDLFDRHKNKEQKQVREREEVITEQQTSNSPRKEIKINPPQPVRPQPVGIQLSLFDQFMDSPVTPKAKPRTENFDPLPFEGELFRFHANGSLVAVNGSQVGYLRNVNDRGAEFHPLDINPKQKTLSVLTLGYAILTNSFTILKQLKKRKTRRRDNS